MLQTSITRLLDIEYPVIQGGMAWVADGRLAAAVSNAGGLGLIAAASMPPDLVREQIRLARALTNRPFGVNIMMMSPHAPDIAALCVEETVPVVTTGAGNPGPYIPAWKQAGIKVIPVIPSVALAKRMARAGADAVVAEGCEAGGHIGELTTLCLVPQVAQAVDIPVIAAGGIADGRGLAAVLMLGAQGVQMGTAFVCAQESPACDGYRRAILAAGDTGTAVTGRSTGHPVRSVRSRFTKRLEQMEAAGAPREELEELALGSLRCAVQEGDPEKSSFMAGQSAGMVHSVRPAAQIIEEVVEQAVSLLRTDWKERGVIIV